MQPPHWKMVTAVVVGNALEFYDFALYGFSAAIFAKLFFPTSDPLSGLIATYGVFASGFLMRPIGAILLGYIGDIQGRQRALELSILFMLLPTLLIGLLPTYASIGVAAPILLALFRLLQGCSVGGEIVGSYAFLAECSQERRWGLTTSWASVGAFLGKAFAIAVLLATTLLFTEEHVLAWAWRIPFLLGGVFALIGFRLRQQIVKFTPQHRRHMREPQVRPPLFEALLNYKVAMAQAAGITTTATIGIYTLNIYAPTFLHTQRAIGYSTSAFSTLACLVCSIVLLPIAGFFSDRWGRRPVMLIGFLLLAVAGYPCFFLMLYGPVWSMIAAHSLMGGALAFTCAPTTAIVVELFPPHIRQTACGIAYNASVMTFGAFSPVVVTALTQQTGDPLAAGYWLVGGALFGLIVLFFTPETALLNHMDLSESSGL